MDVWRLFRLRLRSGLVVIALACAGHLSDLFGFGNRRTFVFGKT